MKQVALPLLLICALTACGKSATPALADTETGSPSKVQSPQVEHDVRPVVTKDVPLDQYVEVTASGTDPTPQQGFDLIAFNGAMSQVDPALPADFDDLANASSKDYYNTQDAFKKKELLATLQPKLEQRMAHFRRSPFIYSEYRFTNNIEGYDFNRGAFPVNVFKGYNKLYAGPEVGPIGLMYDFQLKNKEAVSYFPVPDQELAQRIETLRNSGKPPYLRVYFAAQPKPKNENATAFHHYMTSEIPLTVTNMQLIDRDGSVLASYKPGPQDAADKPSQVPANAASIANEI